ncbi:MAG: hypothetical protein FWG12_04620 [Holophagaceae bacterium]|nr:hypothetical protein [Holophagaceae bacterium]
MQEKTIVALDAVSATLLSAWLCIVIFHFVFRQVIIIFYVDIGAWIVFGGAILLSGLPRWLNDVSDREVIGAFRLWIATCAVALILCMASSAVASPKLKSLQTELSSERTPPQQMEMLERNHARVANFSIQFLCIRAALAIGLALGLKKLPREVCSTNT